MITIEELEAAGLNQRRTEAVLEANSLLQHTGIRKTYIIKNVVKQMNAPKTLEPEEELLECHRWLDTLTGPVEGVALHLRVGDLVERVRPLYDNL